MNRLRVLVPWNAQEAICVTEAASVVGCSLVTVRTWAALHGLGRRVGGRWMLSRVALTMYLDGDARALAAYLQGDRESELVIAYFERCGLLPVMSTIQEIEKNPPKQPKQKVEQFAAGLKADGVAEEANGKLPSGNGHAEEERTYDLRYGCHKIKESDLIKYIKRPEPSWVRSKFGREANFWAVVGEVAPHLLAHRDGSASL